MRRVKSQSRKKSSRTRNASRDEAWRQFLDSNRFHVELEPEAHGVYETIDVTAPDPVENEVRTIERSIARREEEREIARALGAPELVLLLN